MCESNTNLLQDNYKNGRKKINQKLIFLLFSFLSHVDRQQSKLIYINKIFSDYEMYEISFLQNIRAVFLRIYKTGKKEVYVFIIRNSSYSKTVGNRGSYPEGKVSAQ